MNNVVLLAHPEPARLEAWVDLLADAGFNCLTARDGEEALATAGGYAPQLVVVPTELPELQGTEVCLRLKNDRGPEAVAVILLGRSDSQEERFVGEQVGADAYLVEPVSDADLVRTVASLFASKKLNAAPHVLSETETGREPSTDS